MTEALRGPGAAGREPDRGLGGGAKSRCAGGRLRRAGRRRGTGWGGVHSRNRAGTAGRWASSGVGVAQLEFATRLRRRPRPSSSFGGGFWPTHPSRCCSDRARIPTSRPSLSSWGTVAWEWPSWCESGRPFGFFGNLLPAGLQVLTRELAGWPSTRERRLCPPDVLRRGAASGARFYPAWGSSSSSRSWSPSPGTTSSTPSSAEHSPSWHWCSPLHAIIFLPRADPGPGFDAAAAGRGRAGGSFMIAVFFASPYAASWNPYAPDYKPATCPRPKPLRVRPLSGGWGCSHLRES